MKTRHAGLVTMGLVTLIGCSSYIKQPTVCIDRWYGYVQDGGCPSTVKAAAVDETAVRLAALERERQRLADELDAARRQNGTLSSRVSDLERQVADRDRELAALRSGSGDRDRLASQLTSAQSDRDRLAAELAAANQRIADLERQLAEARAAQAAPAPKLESARQGLVRALRPHIAKGDISIDLNSERLLINLASNYLFGSGQDQLKPGGVEALKKVGDVLKDYPEYSVSVAGHTDNRPLRSTLKKKFASNQELSEARAASAAKALAEGGLTSVTTVGHADTQPVASNDTEAGRAQNRRIEIIVK